jgi:predicted metal-dependent peptidase
MENKALNAFDMARVRTRLLLDQPFFGTLAMHLELVETRQIETLQTNGVVIQYNPDFMATLTAAEQVGVLAHEVMHPGLLHPYRRNGRDPREWNEACDYAINPELIRAGFTLPAGALVDPQFDGMSAEQIFSKRRSTPNPMKPEPDPAPRTRRKRRARG